MASELCDSSSSSVILDLGESPWRTRYRNSLCGLSLRHVRTTLLKEHIEKSSSFGNGEGRRASVHLCFVVYVRGACVFQAFEPVGEDHQSLFGGRLTTWVNDTEIRHAVSRHTSKIFLAES